MATDPSSCGGPSQFPPGTSIGDYLSNFQVDAGSNFYSHEGQPATAERVDAAPASRGDAPMDTEGHGPPGPPGPQDGSGSAGLLPLQQNSRTLHAVQLLPSVTAEMLVSDLLSPTVLDGVGFQSFARLLCRDYQPLPRRALLTELENMFSHRSRRVAIALSTPEKLALSVDVWPRTAAKRRFATVNAHCVHQARALSLHVHHQEPPCGGAESDDTLVCEAVAATLRAWKIDESRIYSITSPCDRTSRHFPAVQTHITCAARVLQRAMGQAIEAHHGAIVTVCDAIGADETELAAVREAGTRDWLSWSKLVRQCAKADPGQFAAVRDEIATTASLWRLLRPARKAVAAFLDTDYVPLSVARFQLEEILEAVTKVSVCRDADLATSVRGTAFQVAQVISDALSALKAEDRAEAVLLCSLLDPRYKSQVTSAASSRYDICEDEAFDFLRRHCAAELREAGREASGMGQAEGEVRAYFAEGAAEANSPLRLWWHLQRDRYPTLGLVARRAFCVPSVSAPVRRVFLDESTPSSPESLLVARRRALCEQSDVSPAYIQTVTFLHCNAE
jgi:hypothetical protein